MVMMNTTFFYCQLIFGEWFFIPRDETNCGPIPNGERGWDSLAKQVLETRGIRVIYVLVSFFPLLWTLEANIILFGLFAGNKAEILRDYANNKKLDFQQLVEDQVNQLKRLRKKLEFSRKI